MLLFLEREISGTTVKGEILDNYQKIRVFYGPFRLQESTGLTRSGLVMRNPLVQYLAANRDGCSVDPISAGRLFCARFDSGIECLDQPLIPADVRYTQLRTFNVNEGLTLGGNSSLWSVARHDMCKSFPRPIWPQIIIGDPTVGSESDLRSGFLLLFSSSSHFRIFYIAKFLFPDSKFSVRFRYSLLSFM